MNKRQPSDYGPFLKDVVGKVTDYLALAEKTEAEQIRLYWFIGEAICARGERSAAVVLSEELARVFPEEKGFSPRNIRRMREFYRTYSGHHILAALAFEIGWTRNVLIMEHCTSSEEQEIYLRTVKRTSWSKAELLRSFDDPTLLKKEVDESTAADMPRKQPVSAKGAVSNEESPRLPNEPRVAAVPTCRPIVPTLTQDGVRPYKDDNRQTDWLMPLHAFDMPVFIKSISASEPHKLPLTAKALVSGAESPDLANATCVAVVPACEPTIKMFPQTRGQAKKRNRRNSPGRNYRGISGHYRIDDNRLIDNCHKDSEVHILECDLVKRRTHLPDICFLYHGMVNNKYTL